MKKAQKAVTGKATRDCEKVESESRPADEGECKFVLRCDGCNKEFSRDEDAPGMYCPACRESIREFRAARAATSPLQEDQSGCRKCGGPISPGSNKKLCAVCKIPKRIYNREALKMGQRAKIISNADPLTEEEMRLGRDLVYPEKVFRPKTRGECRGMERPCPFVSCKHHLYLDVDREGDLKINFPDLEVWELKETCSLDIADRAGVILGEIGAVLNITREAVRLVEEKTLRRLRLTDIDGSRTDEQRLNAALVRKKKIA